MGMGEQEGSFERAYPHIVRFVARYGWLEIGADHHSSSFLRALDEGGMVWEGEDRYPSMDAALAALEEALARHLEEERLELS